MANQKKGKKLTLPVVILIIIAAVISCILDYTGVWDKAIHTVNYDTNPALYRIPENERIAVVQFIDVGQGDCTLVTSADEAMLIDSGEKEYADLVMKTMSESGVEKLDYVVVTHAHTDHMGAMAEILADYPAENIILSEPSEDSASNEAYMEFLDAAEDSGAEIILAKPDYKFSVGNAVCTVLSPASVSTTNENNNSVVMHMTAGTTDFLFTGDAESVTEKAIVRNYPYIDADILKVGHHGSKTSSCEAFIDSVRPENAVISVSVDNMYGHPADEVYKILYDRDINVYTTSNNGTIMVTCSVNDYSIIPGR